MQAKGFPLPRNAGMMRKKDYESELKRFFPYLEMQVWRERKTMNQSLKGFPLPRNAGMTRKKDYESELKRKSLHGSVKTLQNLTPMLQHDGMWHTSQQKWLCVRSSHVTNLTAKVTLCAKLSCDKPHSKSDFVCKALMWSDSSWHHGRSTLPCSCWMKLPKADSTLTSYARTQSQWTFHPE